MRKVCSMSKRRKKVCQSRSTVSSPASGIGDHSQTVSRWRPRLPFNAQQDDGALDGRQDTGVADPGGAVRQTRVQPLPGQDGRGSVEPGRGGDAGVRGPPAGGVAEDELTAVAFRPADRGRIPGWGRSAQDPVRTHPDEYFHWEVLQQQSQPESVVTGVRDDPDVRLARLALPGVDEALHDITQLFGGNRGGAVTRFAVGVLPAVRSTNDAPIPARAPSNTASPEYRCGCPWRGRRCDTTPDPGWYVPPGAASTSRPPRARSCRRQPVTPALPPARYAAD
jgi:hypothetical protein